MSVHVLLEVHNQQEGETVRLTSVFMKLKQHSMLVAVAIVVLATGVWSGLLCQPYDSVGQWLRVLGVRKQTRPASPMQRAEVPISSVRSNRVMVALVFGQSNSANFGESPHKAREGVYNFYKGKLYAAQDPLLGAEGHGGSVWTRLGDKLASSMQYDAVVFVALGVGGADIARWKRDGDLHPHLLEALRDLKEHHVPITHLLWHQGEAEARLKTSKSAYQMMFLDMLSSIRQQGVNASMYVSVATRCQEQRDNTEVRQAQQELVNPFQGIYAGPDTDALGLCDRYDGCHFSNEGLEKFAALWLEKLKAK